MTALRRHLPTARVSGAAAGLHLLARLPAGPLGTDIITTTAARHDIALTALSRYHLLDTPCHDDGLVIGYANITPTTIDTAIQRLA